MGLATVVLSCVFTGIWISSYLSIGMGPTGWLMRLGPSGVGIGATNGHLEWFDFSEKEEDAIKKETVTPVPEDEKNQVAVRVVSVRVDFNIRWSISIWSIVVPLTLLSAYLLLSEPQPAKKANGSPGISTEPSGN